MPLRRSKKSTCAYVNNENMRCARNVIQAESYCSLHLGCNKDSEPQDNINFQKDFDAEILAENGDWRGFVFPSKTQFPKEIAFQVKAYQCKFNELNLDRMVFKSPVDFTGSSFYKNTLLRAVIFEDVVDFTDCRFRGQLETLNVQCNKSASFNHADFEGRTTLRINFHGSANINQAIFRDGVIFSGWRNINMRLASALGSATCIGIASIMTNEKPNICQFVLAKIIDIRIRIIKYLQQIWLYIKQTVTAITTRAKKLYNELVHKFSKFSEDTEIYNMFEIEGQLQDVVFLKPDQTVFNQVDLSKVYFRGTNLRGIRFLGVKWWQPKLKRNGLYDELFIRLSKDGPFRYQYLPVLEETCRNARVALEENKCYNMASDFYVGEMEAARAQLGLLRRHLFSVNELYRFASFYGTSVGTALKVLIWFFLLHSSLTLLIQNSTISGLSLGDIHQSALRSFQVLLQQNPESQSGISFNSQRWLDSVFRVLGLIQIAMVAIAFRARIKRH